MENKSYIQKEAEITNKTKSCTESSTNAGAEKTKTDPEKETGQ